MKNPALEPTRLGRLDAVKTPLPAERVRRSVVLLHGYGAPGTDLVGLAPHFQLPEGTQVVFPAAPWELEPGAGPLGGRAWWHIDMMALQMARFTGDVDSITKGRPEGLDEARQALSEALECLRSEHGLVPETTVIGGFSQGAMLSADWALRSDWPLAGLVQLSGTVICEEEWPELLAKRKGLPAFQSHSPDDMVLPFFLAEKLAGYFREAGLDSEFVSFPGGHGIGPEVLTRLGAFLRRL